MGGNLTYVSTWSGWVYVASVVDAYPHRILGWRTAITMTATLAVDTVEQPSGPQPGPASPTLPDWFSTVVAGSQQ